MLLSFPHVRHGCAAALSGRKSRRKIGMGQLLTPHRGHLWSPHSSEMAVAASWASFALFPAARAAARAASQRSKSTIVPSSVTLPHGFPAARIRAREISCPELTINSEPRANPA